MFTISFLEMNVCAHTQMPHSRLNILWQVCCTIMPLPWNRVMREGTALPHFIDESVKHYIRLF